MILSYWGATGTNRVTWIDFIDLSRLRNWNIPYNACHHFRPLIRYVDMLRTTLWVSSKLCRVDLKLRFIATIQSKAKVSSLYSGMPMVSISITIDDYITHGLKSTGLTICHSHSKLTSFINFIYQSRATQSFWFHLKLFIWEKFSTVLSLKFNESESNSIFNSCSFSIVSLETHLEVLRPWTIYLIVVLSSAFDESSQLLNSQITTVVV